MKKIIAISLSLFIIVLLITCNRNNKNNPREKTMSKWKSKYATLYIIDENNGFIELSTDNKKTILFFTFALYNRICVYSGDQYYVQKEHSEPPYEKWKFEKIQNDSFEVIVERTTFFQEGQKLIFELVEENVKESEIPYPPEPEVLPETPDYDFPYQ